MTGSALAAEGAVVIPIQITVVRYVCPFCRRGRSSGKAAVAHIARCWRNPAAKGCKTCVHYDQGEPGDYDYPGAPEGCWVGVDLTEGLVVGCERWQSKEAISG